MSQTVYLDVNGLGGANVKPSKVKKVEVKPASARRQPEGDGPWRGGLGAGAGWSVEGEPGGGDLGAARWRGSRTRPGRDGVAERQDAHGQRAALVAPAGPMAIVATGTPAGICTIESSESRP